MSLKKGISALLVTVLLLIARVASHSVTMRPEHIGASKYRQTLTFTCTADSALTGCQFMWWDSYDNPGPLLELSQGPLSQADSSHLTTEISGYSYSGRGLGAGDCGVSLQVMSYKAWMVACRVRVGNGGWTYAWADLYANDRALLPHTVKPREEVILPGGEARFMLKAQEPLSTCRFVSPGLKLVFCRGAESADSTGRHRYLGSGLRRGDCGLALRDVSEEDNGPVKCYISMKPLSKGSKRYMVLIVARFPYSPTLSVAYSDVGVTATCEVHGSRPLAQITWFLGFDIIRQDSLDDSTGNAQDAWRWPWMEGSIIQRLILSLNNDVNGKKLMCVVSHVTLAQPLVATKTISFTVAAMCPALKVSSQVIGCVFEGNITDCSAPSPVGTKAKFHCKAGYVMSKPHGYSSVTCGETGEWSRPIYQCILGCGKMNIRGGEVLISNAATAHVGQFPWHVSIYKTINAVITHICGGTLIKPNLVVSAAHCFWNPQNGVENDASMFKIAAGKHYREWDAPEKVAPQMRDVAEIFTHEQYLGRQGNHAADIALIRLSQPVAITSYVNVICIDWDNERDDYSLSDGNNGTVPGWGFTETGDLSDELKMVDLPFVSFRRCADSLPVLMRPLLTPKKFCAGHVNKSTSVCRGDSGGGLVFLDSRTDRYYIRGIASITFKPFGNTDICYSQFYSGFTKFSYFLSWIATKYGGI